MTIAPEAPADREEPPLRLPSLPEEPAPNGFPVLMTVAPIVVALVLFAVLRTPYVLMFAILGPVLGTANVIDQRIGRRRRRARAQARFEEDAAEARVEIARAHARLIARRRIEQPLARDLVAGARRLESGVVVGTTTVRSGLRVEGAGSDDGSRALVELAARMDGAPIMVDSDWIAVTGPRAEVTGAVRALVVQLLADRPAARIAICGDRARGVVHELRAAGIELVDAEDAEVGLCADAPAHASSIHRPAQTPFAQITIEAGGLAVLTDSAGRKTRIRADSLGATMLAGWLPAVVNAQRDRARSTRGLPSRCELGDLEPVVEGELAANFLLAADGARPIDLVAHGPHAVIGGTTGSGKSELLIGWATALAKRWSSEECTLLCIDFKGGATFDAVEALPHCVGIVTDLDDDEALRVVSSLRAEVRRRELSLRGLGARDIADLESGTIPRLVVMVDEYQALMEAHPDLHEVFGDLAARGRSLGIHLILCTQRPSGTFRENLLANAAIRICLRVEQASDSITLLGSAAGTTLPRDLRGRALLKIGSAEADLVHVARARPMLIEEVAARESASRVAANLAPVRRPWHPPLPEQLAPESLEHARASVGVPYALGDLPERQQQPIIGLDRPGRHLFVLGMVDSGKTGTTQAIAESAGTRGVRVRWIRGSVEDAWDGIEALLRQPASGWTMVLIDDVDLLEQQLDDEHRAEWLDRLQRLLRTGTRLNLSVVLTARRVSGILQKIRGLCSDTLYLAAPSRQEWILQGADPSHWSDGLVPGRGRLGNLLVQVARASESNAPTGAGAWQPFAVPSSGLVVTGRRLGPVRAALGALGCESSPVPNAAAVRNGELEGDLGRAVLLGEVDQWNAAYGSLPKLAERMPVLAVGVTPGEWRSTFRGDPIYPALEDPFTRALLRMPDGTVSRVRLRDGRPVSVQQRVPSGD